MANNEKVCPLTQQNCRSDCAWAIKTPYSESELCAMVQLSRAADRGIADDFTDHLAALERIGTALNALRNRY